MPRAWFAIPGDLETLTGGYAYARQLTAALADRTWDVQVVTLPPSFPLPTRADHGHACRTLSALASDRPVLIDGLAFSALDARFLANAPQRWVALIHHPLSLETGLDAEMGSRLRKMEKAALAAASAVIVTSQATARCLIAEYDVPAQRVTIARPGTAPAARSSGNGAVPQLLSVATLTPRKGYDLLVDALDRIAAIDWTAVWVGSLSRDPKTARAVREAVQRYGLADRITFAGEVAADPLKRFYRNSDLFVLASRHEGYGMAYAEALACGLPIVGCAVGALTETVPTDAGFLVPPDDIAALAGALERLLTNESQRQEMAEAAWRHGSTLPTWEETAAQVEVALSAAMTT